eukprot:8278888-Alexandrium_andersonii.AAC.1
MQGFQPAQWLQQMADWQIPSHSQLTFNGAQVHECLAALPRNKGLGPDQVPGELWRTIAPVVSHDMAVLWAMIELRKQAPEAWCGGALVARPKKG